MVYCDIFCPLHHVIQVKYFTSVHTYLDLTYEMDLLTWSFMVVKSNVGVLKSPG